MTGKEEGLMIVMTVTQDILIQKMRNTNKEDEGIGERIKKGMSIEGGIATTEHTNPIMMMNP